MRFSFRIFSMVCLILLMTDCREPFQPDFETGVNDFLVVEGFINVGTNAVTKITLSRVAPVATKEQTFEDNGTLIIESEEGDQYPLTGEGNGIYKSDSLSLDVGLEYRLLIAMPDGKAYASGFTKPKVSPPIDSIHWKKGPEGIKLYVASHDPAGNTKYYKWDYTETWEFHSAYVSTMWYNASDGFFFPYDDPPPPMYRCWKYAIPPDLRFGSTTQFQSDAINFPLISFGIGSDRTSVRYSVIVEQRVLAKDEFDYLQKIQKNSVLTGSLFDPLPSEIYGNITSSADPDEIVVGYIGASSTETKRIFVNSEEFGEEQVFVCSKVAIPPQDFKSLFETKAYIPIEFAPFGRVWGAPAGCMDCRLRGTPVEPEFWN